MPKILQDSRPPREIRLKKIASALGALASLSTAVAAWAGITAYQQHQQVVQITNDVRVAIGQLASIIHGS